MNKQLEQKLRDLPREPGVYFHKNAAGEIIYIGKAAVLRNRVRQYFQKSRLRDPKTDLLVSEIVDTDWQVVASEMEALFLEGELIRRYMPRYNILLRDDKAMSYIRIDYSSDYPTVSTTRRPLDDGARYFGPYFSVTGVRKALKILRRVFPYATRRVGGQKRVTLHYHLGLDPGLEEGKTTLKDYRANLRRLISVIEGKRSHVISELKRDMARLAKAQDFEAAAKVRNQLSALERLSQQTVFSDKEFLDLAKDHALNELASLLGLYETKSEHDRVLRLLRRIEGYDISHMSGTNVVASMVVFTNGVSDKAQYRKFKVTQKNDDFHNMYEVIYRRLSDKHLHGWGKPDLLMIDGGQGQLNAALRAQTERGTNIPMIGLAKRNDEIIVKVDGSLVNIEQILNNVSGYIATEKNGFISINLHPGQFKNSDHSSTLYGEATSQSYANLIKLLQRIRDESHRFAISYHTSLKRAGQTRSQLENIPGVGPATRKKLIKTFGSVAGIKAASQGDVAKIVGLAKAKQIKAHL